MAAVSVLDVASLQRGGYMPPPRAPRGIRWEITRIGERALVSGLRAASIGEAERHGASDLGLDQASVIATRAA